MTRKSAENEDRRNLANAYPRPDLATGHVVTALQQQGRAALTKDYLTDDDRKVVEEAIPKLDGRRLFELLREVPTPVANQVLQEIETIAGAAYLVGVHGGVSSNSAFAYVNRGETTRRRWDYMQRPEVQAENKVIREELVKFFGCRGPLNDVDYGNADKIAGQVNNRLKNRLSISTIADRIRYIRNGNQ